MIILQVLGDSDYQMKNFILLGNFEYKVATFLKYVSDEKFCIFINTA